MQITLPPSLNRLIQRLPIYAVLLASVLVIGIHLVRIARTVSVPYPVDMWEAAAIGVASRVAEGEPLYERIHELDSPEPGIYAPLQLFVLGALYRFTGPEFWVLRALNLLAGAIFIYLLLRCFKSSRNLWSCILAIAVLLVADHQLTGLWELPRLDAILVLAAGFYLISAFLAITRNSRLWLAIALTTFVLGFFWKQTMLGVAMIPFVASLFMRPAPPRFSQVLSLVLPIGVVALCAALIKLLSPNLFEAMFRVPGRFPIALRSGVLSAYNIALSIPLVWVAAVWLTAQQSKVSNDDPNKLIWAWITFIAAFPLNLIAMAKAGGGSNSFAPAIYGAYGVVLWCIPSFRQALSDTLTSPYRRYGLGVALCVGLVASTVSPFYTPRRVELGRGFGDHGRKEVIRIVRELPGKIVCPQDPTITLEAKGHAGVPMVHEYDRHVWQYPLPKVNQELKEADYVITFGRPGTPIAWPFEPGFELLSSSAYQQLTLPELKDSDYIIWKNLAPGTQSLQREAANLAAPSH